MKNNPSDLIGLFMRMKAHDGAYANTAFSVDILCRAERRYSPEDFKLNGTMRRDHLVPQNPARSSDIVRDLGLQAKKDLTGTDVLNALFEKHLPGLPKEFRPAQDNMANLCVRTSLANGEKSNDVSGTTDKLFGMLCDHTRAYSKIIERDSRVFLRDLCEEFGKEEPEVTEVLYALDSINQALQDKNCVDDDKLTVTNIDLNAAFGKATKLVGENGNFTMYRYIEFKNGDSIIDLGMNFRESLKRFTDDFMPHALQKLNGLREDRALERQHGRHLRAA